MSIFSSIILLDLLQWIYFEIVSILKIDKQINITIDSNLLQKRKQNFALVVRSHFSFVIDVVMIM